VTTRRYRALAALVLLTLGCGDAPGGAALMVQRRDAGDRSVQDGGLGDGRDAGPGRPDGGAVLPPAEVELELPFGGPAFTHPIEVDADLGLLDVVFSVDTTGSMQSAIDNLQEDLRLVLIEQLRARVPLVSFGVTSFQDFPLGPFGAEAAPGSPADAPFRLHTAITSDVAEVASAVARLDRPLGQGGDLPESSAEALFQIATGEGYETRGETLIAPYDGRALEGGGDVGGVGFRRNALRVVVQVTDAPSHRPQDYATQFPGTHSLLEAAQALAAIGAHVVSIVSRVCLPDECEDPTSNYQQARRDLELLALETGGVTGAAESCPTGLGGSEMPLASGVCPLVFDVDAAGQGLSGLLVDGIVALIDELRFGAVSAEVAADPLGFVQGIEALPGTGADPAPVADREPAGMPDGVAETFVGVPGGSTLRFAIRLRNDRIAPTDVDQRFRVTLRVVGDGLLLREQTLRVVVPAGPASVPAPMDAGADAAQGGGDDDAGQ
jgi:hypothetical protein